SKVECAPDRTDGIVVRLLRPYMSAHHCHQLRVANVEKPFFADLWPPDLRQQLAVSVVGCEREVLHSHSHPTVLQESIKYVITSAGSLSLPIQTLLKTIVWKLF